MGFVGICRALVPPHTPHLSSAIMLETHDGGKHGNHASRYGTVHLHTVRRGDNISLAYRALPPVSLLAPQQVLAGQTMAADWNEGVDWVGGLTAFHVQGKVFTEQLKAS
ncbi:hypothetical protein P170DRAFT_66685 [Aspergillus steynii IBT 23096]|uniref:Uncharacterized protein n=1 Tax=Aspergillus steynii IBT 23096 TaxID=1392250 RepID=A0A2I2FTK8_9EURO|nr:uncharacterized protein P170DRAFT_66685 [Aspergillus steynii IBT 23096]PLB43969.1 hypothetical protein P170DRAFT_66685 [Aspergillus steynii IBT 23096]